MKPKQRLLLIITTFLMLVSANSQAGRQGISFYYGIGAGAMSPGSYDAAGFGDVMFGMEEDGWAFEATAYKSLSSGSDEDNVDYSAGGANLGIAYRTIERNNSWFKYKLSATNMDFDLSDTDGKYKSSGLSYSFGWGMRMSRDSRMELEYSFYDSQDLNDPVHLATFRYFWGGSEYQGKDF